MQVSYSITGVNGLDAASQLEARIRHDSLEAGPSAIKLLDSVAGWVRAAVEDEPQPVTVEIDLVVRARTTQLGSGHLAPPAEPVAESLADPTSRPLTLEGNTGAPTDAEGDETDSGGAS